MTMQTQDISDIDSSLMDFMEFLIYEVENYLLEHGWCQHQMRNTHGKVDIIGAITDVAAKYYPYSSMYGYDEFSGINGKIALVESLKILISRPLKGSFLSTFNDDKTTTLGAVIQLLQMAREIEIYTQFLESFDSSLSQDGKLLPNFAD